MQPFNIHILGCGSALPTLKHYASAQVVEVRDKFFMVDCGEGTQIQLRKTHIHFSKLQAIFISHLHGDHCFGLMGIITTFGMLGRTAPLQVYGPVAMGPVLDIMMQQFGQGLGYDVRFHPVDTTKHQIVMDDRSLTVESIPLEHRIPCCGYLFREKPTLPHIRRDMIDYYEIPTSQINNIKNGLPWNSPEGKIIPASELTEPAEPTRSYAYCSDTRYIPSLHTLVDGVDVLYHESTYASDYEDRARLYHHSTARQAATVARDAHVGRLLLGHYSARYDDESLLLKEAQEIFPESYLTNEGMVVKVGVRS